MRKIVVTLGLALAVMFMTLPVTTPAFAAPAETGDKCFDGRDNDRDGLIDADDPDCADAPPPPTPGPTLEDQVTELQAQVAELQGLVATLQTDLISNTAADNANHHVKYSDAEAIAAVGPHSPDHSDLLSGVHRLVDPKTGVDTFRFEGMNVQVVSGSGNTYVGDGNGNLIIGYNELRPETWEECQTGDCDFRTGAHNLVIGRGNNYSSYGGFVAGAFNAVTAQHATVAGGMHNDAAGPHSAILSGHGGTTLGNYAGIVSGNQNTVHAANGAIVGGGYNDVYGSSSVITGGWSNETHGGGSTLSGGYWRTSDGDYSWAAGSLYEAQ
ncbi:hypothetical protein ACFL0N_01100 [Pseudomonadota bacterium]